MTERSLLILVRLIAVSSVILGMPLLWGAMMRLSWQVDCVIVAIASVLYAYGFERQDHR